jgi:hypothetical protein
MPAAFCFDQLQSFQAALRLRLLMLISRRIPMQKIRARLLFWASFWECLGRTAFTPDTSARLLYNLASLF